MQLIKNVNNKNNKYFNIISNKTRKLNITNINI